jgi:hypothetical protein
MTDYGKFLISNLYKNNIGEFRMTNILKSLAGLRNSLKQEFKFFPDECCREAAKRATEFGLDETFGLFIDENGIGHDHNWNKKGGKIYDITAGQFPGTFPDIVVLNEDSQEAASRYVEGVYLMI